MAVDFAALARLAAEAGELTEQSHRRAVARLDGRPSPLLARIRVARPMEFWPDGGVSSIVDEEEAEDVAADTSDDVEAEI